MASLSPRKSTRAATRRRAPVVDDSDDDDQSVAPQETEDDFTPAPEPAAPKTSRRGRPKKPTADAAATPAAKTTRAGRAAPARAAAAAATAPVPRRRTRATASIEPDAEAEPEPEQLASPTGPVAPPSAALFRPRAETLEVEAEAQAGAEEHVQVKKEPASTRPAHAFPEPEIGSDVSKLELLTPQPSISSPPASPDRNDTSSAPVLAMPTAPATPLVDITNESAPEPEPAAKHSAPPPETAMGRTLEPIDIVVRKRSAALPSSQEPAVPKARIVITNLVLINFKSYAGRQVVGPFHASFSAVVGPNGSGKSNVIDSLLFVFGFRASKMRQGKISALIHNSDAYPDLDYCGVEVHFEDVMDLPGGGTEVIPNSTIIVSRKAFKNNSSKYFINNKESNFTTVTTLLRDRGVDLDHKRFLILQGEVEAISQMKPKAPNEHEDGLLEYLEDIIGTSKYKTPIEESAAKTETLNEVCAEKQSRVKHVENEKSGLEDKKNKALAYLRDENELAIKKAGLYQLFISDLNNHLIVTREAVAQMEAQLTEELQKHQGNEEGIKQLQKQYNKRVKDLERLEKDSQEALKEMTRVEKETVKFEEKMKFLAAKQKKLEKTKETSRMGISGAETLVRQYADDIERFAVEIADLEQEMKVEGKELEAIRASLAGKTQGLSDQIAAMQESLEPWRAKVNEKQSAIAVAQSELDILREKANSGAKNIAEAEAKIDALEESKKDKAVELDECKVELKQVGKESQKMQAQIEDLAQKEPVLRTQLSSARQKADEARSSLSATQTQGNVLTGLMRMKESGRINGFHGRLGNLGAIDMKYDVAISTACPQLDNMVVDTVEVGQQCIDHLRKNNLGRANFILLDRLAQRDLSPVNTPENVPRLFDLVKPKHDKFRPAFFSVLQNTLVAKDLVQANRIAYGAQRWRVVTLDGQLIDKSGTMSGGGTRVAKGGMSSKLSADVTKDQVSRLEQDRDALEHTFSDLQKQHRDLETKQRQLKDQIPQLETKAQKIALELDSFDRNIADSHRRIKELSAEQTTSKTDRARVSALEKTVATMEKEVSKLHSETAGVEAEIKALQDKIMEIGGVKLRSQKAKVDGLKQQIDNLVDTMSNSEVSKSKEEKQHAKHTKAFADATKELEKLAVESEKVAEGMQAQKRDTAGIMQQAEEAQETLEARREELQVLKTELDEKTAEFNETRAVEIEMRNKLEEGQKGLNEYVKKEKYYLDKMSKLTYQNLSDLGEEEESAGLPTYSKDELEDMDKGELQDEIAELEKKNENTNVDLSVLAEYRKRVEEHSLRSLDLAEALAARDAENRNCSELRDLRKNAFKEGYDTISARLKEMYQIITMGGNAELELVDSMDPFSEGVTFSVRPPNKNWKIISNLSGGEKTLSSLALVFALHHYRPTPLYVMDEIDAALDFRNVSIVAAYIKERTKNAQFIVISLRNNMFESAARLVGVYKVNHMTKSVTIENKDYLRGEGKAAPSQSALPA